MDLVSIIMPLYNSARFLSLSIDSVLAQTYQNWELILIDDCSTDNSFSIGRMYCDQDSRIKLIKLDQNSGAAVARNKGISKANGRYIAFLDSDDLWLPNKLDLQINFMIDANILFSYTAYEKIDEKGQEIFKFGVPSMLSYRELLKTCVIGCLTVVYDAQLLGKVYMPLETKREDYALWLKILREKEIIAYGLNKILANYRVYQGQSSSKKINMAKENWRLLREQERLPLHLAFYNFLQYAFRGLLRSKFPLLAKKIGFLVVPDEN